MYVRIINLWMLLLALAVSGATLAQKPLQTGRWRAFLHRQDGQDIVFNFQFDWQKNKPVLAVINGAERLQVIDLLLAGDSLSFNMPVFESSFRAHIYSKDSINGIWTRGTASGKNIEMPFSATARQSFRFVPAKGQAARQISGKYAVQFFNRQGEVDEPAIGVFTQKGNRVEGSILTPTGDYRYMEGQLTGDSLVLSAFDGIHALLVTAQVKGAQLSNGVLYSGPGSKQAWQGVKNDTATLPDLAAMYLKKGEDGYINFTFKDLDGKAVSLRDERFKNKVVVIQLMGSWCPNCMDETAFLSEYYRQNHQRGVEIVSLAYEYSTDLERSRRSLRKFQQKFNVAYPMLITGVAVTDTLRTEKTLPQFTPIKMFPTSIILDKTGKVSKIDNSFFGPGTGQYYTAYKAEFEKTINGLLSENK